MMNLKMIEIDNRRGKDIILLSDTFNKKQIAVFRALSSELKSMKCFEGKEHPCAVNIIEPRGNDYLLAIK